jgi:hypothetical protein
MELTGTEGPEDTEVTGGAEERSGDRAAGPQGGPAAGPSRRNTNHLNEWVCACVGLVRLRDGWLCQPSAALTELLRSFSASPFLL